MTTQIEQLRLSEDAAIVLALAETAIPFAVSPEDEAERWMRLLRLHGEVGRTLQALGVGEAPLAATPPPAREPRTRPLGEDVLARVATAAAHRARARAASAITTLDVLHAVLDVYGVAFERALHIRGTTRQELLERLAGVAPVGR